MLFYTVGQSRIFLTMLYAGLIAGAYVMLDNAMRQLFQAGRLLSLLMDLVMGLLLGCIVIFALLLSADGELRLYALLGAVCGFILFTATLGRLLPPLLCSLAKPIGLFFRALGRSRLIRRLMK